jgi:glycosyltransferase involved in cell wall biosynthesis
MPHARLRIAQIAPLAESVPPKLYGGTERVVAWLIEELVALGHDVTLFASGDSATRAKLVPAVPRSLRLGRPRTDPAAAHAALLEMATRRAQDFDIIHSHLDWLHLPLLSRADVPFLTTLHGRLDLPGLASMAQLFPEAPFVSISESQRRPLPDATWLGTVYHGMPETALQPSFDHGDYLAFLGRLSAEKGPARAMRIARAADMPLRIAAKLPRASTGYYKEQLEPLIDGDRIRITGEVDERAKQPFLAGAAALLFPIDWPEPFGLVMIEAMACGTPVIAFPHGAVPEVLEDGVSGFIVANEDEAVQAVKRVGELDRAKVRQAFERRFTARRMANDYVELYQKLLEGSPVLSASADPAPA